MMAQVSSEMPQEVTTVTELMSYLVVYAWLLSLSCTANSECIGRAALNGKGIT